MTKDNFCIIMAGGVGSRFWPMSKYNNPKQFTDVMGSGMTLLQSTFHRFEAICPRENIIIITGDVYIPEVRNQIPDLLPYQVLGEPMRRNTSPCVAYAASVIHSINPNANVVVTPADHAIFKEDCFVRDVNQAINIAISHDWIVTLGISPTSPNTEYGYIQFSDDSVLADVPNLHEVITFTEKPPLEMASKFLSTGEFFWNSGLFIWRLPVLMQAFKQYLPSIAENFFSITPDTSKEEIEHIYSTCETISIDNGIMEKAENVHVLEATFGWSDVETWDTLFEAYPKDENNNAIVNGDIYTYEVKNCVVHVPNNRTLVLQGLDGYVIAASEDCIMICQRGQEERIYKFASDVEIKHMRKDLQK